MKRGDGGNNSRVQSSYLSESSGSLSSGDSGIPPPKPPHPVAAPAPPPASSTPSSSLQLSGPASLDSSHSSSQSQPLAFAPPVPASPGEGRLEVFRVTLHKERTGSDFGFSVSDGENEGGRGVFIKAIRPGGPADRSGAVRPLDRLLQVNEQWVERLGCESAVPLLLAASQRVVLLLARAPHPASTFLPAVATSTSTFAPFPSAGSSFASPRLLAPPPPPSTIQEVDEDALTPSPPASNCPLQTQL